MVKPLTWTSYTTVSCHGVPGGRSFPQSKYGFTTTERGTNAALSASLVFSGSRGPWPYTLSSPARYRAARHLTTSVVAPGLTEGSSYRPTLPSTTGPGGEEEGQRQHCGLTPRSGFQHLCAALRHQGYTPHVAQLPGV